jgi:hypothetical protein
MNGEEMNEFLDSIGGLKNGWHSDAEPIKSCGIFEVEEGWYPLIKELITDLIALGWDKEVTQVKEKFGGLRFYVNSESDEMFKRIQKAEADSYVTCEVTGNPGKLRTDLGWHRTLCDEEYDKALKKKYGNK